MMAEGKAECRPTEFWGVIMRGRLLKRLVGNVSGSGSDDKARVARSFVSLREEELFNS